MWRFSNSATVLTHRSTWAGWRRDLRGARAPARERMLACCRSWRHTRSGSVATASRTRLLPRDVLSGGRRRLRGRGAVALRARVLVDSSTGRWGMPAARVSRALAAGASTGGPSLGSAMADDEVGLVGGAARRLPAGAARVWTRCINRLPRGMRGPSGHRRRKRSLSWTVLTAPSSRILLMPTGTPTTRYSSRRWRRLRSGSASTSASIHLEFWLLLATFAMSLVELLRPRVRSLLVWAGVMAIVWTPKIGAEALSANADHARSRSFSC